MALHLRWHHQEEHFIQKSAQISPLYPKKYLKKSNFSQKKAPPKIQTWLRACLGNFIRFYLAVKSFDCLRDRVCHSIKYHISDDPAYIMLWWVCLCKQSFKPITGFLTYSGISHISTFQLYYWIGSLNQKGAGPPVNLIFAAILALFLDWVEP